MTKHKEPSDVAVLAARITGSDHGVKPDERDAEILAERVRAWEARQGPRVGDFVIFAADGSVGRFTHDWGEDIQTTVRGGGFGPNSYHLDRAGWLSHSGSLDPAIDKRRLVDTGETRLGRVWFFHHDWMTAHNAVHAEIPCRVYRETDHLRDLTKMVTARGEPHRRTVPAGILARSALRGVHSRTGRF